tara:strand:+ start:1795 stop:2727 length:933 start_codon:yes stop_codon:yes gene_type:complete
MKVDPIEIIINEKNSLNYQSYFISGNEYTLMKRVQETIISGFKKKDKYIVRKVDSLEAVNVSENLFNEKTINVFESTKSIEKNLFKSLDAKENIFIIFSENSPKNKVLKNVFLNERNCCLVDCYEINEKNKEKVLNYYLNKNNLVLDKEIFLYILQNTDNRFAFFEQCLNNIISIKNINLDVVNKLITQDVEGVDRVFFEIFKNNESLIFSYSKKVIDNQGLNKFYYSIRNYCQLVIESETISELENKIPIYLFKEKPLFIKIFKKLDKEKKRGLLNLFHDTEIKLRTLNEFQNILGLRFLLNLKKIIVS